MCAALLIMAVSIPAMIVLWAASMFFIANLVVAFLSVIGIILYIVAAAKISAKLGAAGQHIPKLARKIAGCVVGVLVANLLYFVYPTVVREETQPVASVIGSVLILNFIQPLCYSGVHYCILHFLLVTIKRKRKVGTHITGSATTNMATVCVSDNTATGATTTTTM